MPRPGQGRPLQRRVRVATAQSAARDYDRSLRWALETVERRLCDLRAIAVQARAYQIAAHIETVQLVRDDPNELIYALPWIKEQITEWAENLPQPGQSLRAYPAAIVLADGIENANTFAWMLEVLISYRTELVKSKTRIDVWRLRKYWWVDWWNYFTELPDIEDIEPLPMPDVAKQADLEIEPEAVDDAPIFARPGPAGDRLVGQWGAALTKEIFRTADFFEVKRPGDASRLRKLEPALMRFQAGHDAAALQPVADVLGRLAPTSDAARALLDRTRLIQRAATELAPPPPERTETSKWRLDRFTEGTPPATEFVLQPIFPLGVAGLLFGAGGLGKSMIALDLCLQVAVRTKMNGTGNLNFMAGPLGCSIPPEAAGASVFITLEDSADEIHRRIAALDPENTRRGAPVFVLPGVDIQQLNPVLVAEQDRVASLTEFAATGLDQMLDEIADDAGVPVKLLVLDPAGDFAECDENDARPVKLLLRRMREIAQRRRMTIILIGHVAKAFDADSPTMRGSSAWIANSRSSYAIWKPEQERAQELAKKAGVEWRNIVLGNLVKANHAGAPVNHIRVFERQPSGRLIDITEARQSDDAGMIDLLVTAIAEAAAAGHPFQATGLAGLFASRSDLPAALQSLSRHRIEALYQTAEQAGRLVKSKFGSGSLPKWLDIPTGPIATGRLMALTDGSRADAIAKWRKIGQQY